MVYIGGAPERGCLIWRKRRCSRRDLTQFTLNVILHVMTEDHDWFPWHVCRPARK